MCSPRARFPNTSVEIITISRPRRTWAAASRYVRTLRNTLTSERRRPIEAARSDDQRRSLLDPSVVARTPVDDLLPVTGIVAEQAGLYAAIFETAPWGNVAYQNSLLSGRLRTVIADSVDLWPLTHEWRSIAERAGRRALEVELVCSDVLSTTAVSNRKAPRWRVIATRR